MRCLTNVVILTLITALVPLALALLVSLLWR